MTMRKVKLGFVGCGRISNKHFEAIKQLADAIEVVAVCDPDASKVSKAAEQFDCAHFTDLDHMLSCGLEMDIVTIATPNGYHPEHSLKCARAGYDVLCEKPMAVGYEEAKILKDEFKKLGREFFLIHQNRYNDPVLQVKKAIDEGRFGKLYMITSNVFWQRPQEYYEKEAWHGTSDLDGGAFMTQGSHYVDMLNWFAGDNIKHIYASLDTLDRKIDTEDTGSVIIKWNNGIIGNVNLTVLTYPKNFEGSITLIGETGTVKLGGVALNKIEHAVFADGKEIADETANYETDSVYGFGHLRVYERIANFFNSDDRSGLIDIDDAFTSFSILDAIINSSKKNQPIIF